MPADERIQAMFDDMGLGTEDQRERFALIGSSATTPRAETPVVFLVCTSETEGEEKPDAKLAADPG